MKVDILSPSPSIRHRLILGILSLFCTLSVWLAALPLHSETLPPLPPHDVTYRMSSLDVLSDPQLFRIFAPSFLFAWLTYYILSIVFLRRTSLAISAPVDFAVTTATAALLSPAFGHFSAVLAFIFGIFTMFIFWSNARPRGKSPTNSTSQY